MKKQQIIGIVLLVGMAMGACVPQAQFAEVNGENQACKSERDQLFEENEALTVSNTELKAKLEGANMEIERAIAKCQSDAEELNLLKGRYETLDKRYNDLKQAQASLLSGSDAEARSLIQKLDATQSDLYQREDQLNQLSQKLDRDKQELQKLTAELERRNMRLIELERTIAQKDSVTDALRQKVSNALLGFENQGLSVSKKNGKVYVSLDEKLLFGSGSTQVDPRGVSALKKLAGVLEQNRDINITIEGHTDDVPVMSGSKFNDNWDLSVQRSTAIIRILLNNSNINPKRLTASGRGEHMPVDPQKTPEARQKNRRTEIILTPNLDEVFELLESN